MNLIEAFKELYETEPNYNINIRYSSRFNPYNANVKRQNNNLTFSLSREWEDVDKEIKKGLIQELMLKILKKRIKPKKKKTLSMDMYNTFMKKIHIAAPKIHSDPILKSSFERVNSRFFDNMLEKTNLKWSNSLRKLGSYEYGSDTITISKALKENQELMDYVMYHEMLHKKHKFKKNKSRSYHHTKEFKNDEERFPNHKLLEKKLSSLIRKKKMFGWF